MSAPHVAPLHARPHFNPWVVAVIALAAALAGLTAWVIVDRTTGSSTASATGATPGLAPPEIVAMLENRIAAWNRGDGKAAAAFYATDAIMEEHDVSPAVVTTGRVAIGNRLQWIIDLGLRMRPIGTPVQVGRFVGEPVAFYAASGMSPAKGEGVLVFELDKSGKIAHQWVTGEVR